MKLPTLREIKHIVSFNGESYGLHAGKWYGLAEDSIQRRRVVWRVTNSLRVDELMLALKSRGSRSENE